MSELRMIHCVNQGFIEVLGKEETSVFEQSLFQYQKTETALGYLSDIKTFLANRYDSAEAAGLAFSIGRCSYRFVREAYEPEVRFRDLDFRLLPPHRRADEGLKRLLSEVFNPVGIRPTFLQDEKKQVWLLEFESNGLTFPARIIGGLMQEMLADVSGGRFYPVEITENEIEGSVRISIAENPLGH